MARPADLAALVDCLGGEFPVSVRRPATRPAADSLLLGGKIKEINLTFSRLPCGASSMWLVPRILVLSEGDFLGSSRGFGGACGFPWGGISRVIFRGISLARPADVAALVEFPVPPDSGPPAPQYLLVGWPETPVCAM